MVSALAQTQDGYLWVGTSAGLLRFNGVSFDNYQPQSGVFPSRIISTLFAEAGGGLWIGYARGGASYLRQGHLVNYSVSNGLPFGRIRSFAQTWNGGVWVAATGGLATLKENRWIKDRAAWDYPGNSPDTLFVDSRGTLWAGTGKEAVFLPRGGRKFINTHIACVRVRFSESPDGVIWVLDTKGMRMIPMPRPAAQADPARGGKTSSTMKLLFDRTGALWFASITDEGDDFQNAIWRFPSFFSSQPHPFTLDLSAAQAFTGKQGLSGGTSNCILEDREGNVWVGTDTGLNRFRHRNLEWFPVNQTPRLYSLVAGESGNIWAGSTPGSLLHVPDGHPVPGSPQNVLGAYRGFDGVTWLYPAHKLWRWVRNRFSEVPLPQNTLSDRVNSLTTTRTGAVWISIAGSGEYQGDGVAWKFVKVLPHHPDWTAQVAYTDSRNRVWLGLQNYAAELDHGRTTIYSTEQGLALGPILSIGGNDGQVWLGGEKGLALLAGNHFQQIFGAGKMDFGVVTGIVATPQHGLWLTATSGIVHIFQNEVKALLQDARHLVDYEVFDLVSDLPEPLEGEALFARPITQAADGILWFQTISGVARLDPAHIVRNSVPPPISIRSITADNKSYSGFSPAELPPWTKQVRFDYDGLSLTIPERVKFRYRLVGLDSDWIDAGTRRQAFYTNLSPRSYSFEVLACNNSGVWAEAPAVWQFTIQPAWYQTPLFRVLVVAAFLLAAFALFRLRIRQTTVEIQRKLDAQMEERTRIARELHDTILQGFYGLLLRVQSAANRLPSDQPARKAIEESLDHAEKTLREGRETIRGLRGEPGSGDDILGELQSLASSLGLEGTNEVTFRIQGEKRPIHPVVHSELLRIGREALSNALTHSCASRIEVTVVYEPRGFSLSVLDDGKGMKPETLSGRGRDGHWGMRGMRERAAAVGASLQIASGLNTGTRITLHVPASLSFAISNDQPKR